MSKWGDLYFHMTPVPLICYILYTKDLYYYIIVELLTNIFGIFLITLVNFKHLRGSLKVSNIKSSFHVFEKLMNQKTSKTPKVTKNEIMGNAKTQQIES